MRVGIGYDIHPLVAGRRLVLGGVEIPFRCGLLGHSDADVLTHAIIDALLGAAALGDIGQHFPPGDATYKDISSLILLRQTAGLLEDRGWTVINIDATIVAQEPRLAPHLSQMQGRIAETLGLEAGTINVKAASPEGLGFIGVGQGMAACAVALIKARE